MNGITGNAAAHEQGPPCIISLDDVSSTAPSAPERPKPEQLSQQYSEIAQCLVISEAGSFQVGVPLLFPSARVQSLSKQYSPPLDYFVQMYLANVQTSTIEAYQEDLAPRAATTSKGEVAPDLNLGTLTLIERYSFSILGPVLVFLVASLVSSWLGGEGAFAGGVVTILALASFFFAVYLSSEPQRRRSFAAALERELMRRKGLYIPFSRRIPVASIGGGGVGE